MNKINQYLIPASLAALLFALLGGLWLVWQTVEESRALERHNRELQASLEASRIRVANFCEYPTDVLCRMDERSGLVAGALPGELSGMPEAEGKQLPAVPAVEIIPERNDAPALAIEHVEKTAKAQAEVPAQVLPAVKETALPAPVEEKPVPVEKNKAEPVTEAMPAPAEPAKPEEEKTLTIEPQAEVPVPNPASAPADEKPEYRHEIKGRLSPELPVKEEAKDVAPVVIEKKETPAEKPKPEAKKAAEAPKKTWSRTELDGGIFVFTLTGSGPSLPARGALLSSPWRYELRLSGNWEIRQHSGISHRLVSRMSTRYAEGETVVTFHLKSKPYRCSLHRPDERTASVRIR